MSVMGMAPTVERVRKSADIDLPIVDTKRRRAAFRLVGPVEKMWRDGRIRDEQMEAFRRFGRDLAITNPLRTLHVRAGAVPATGESEVEEVLSLRQLAFKRLDDLERSLEPRALEAMRSAVLNDTSLEDIGRRVLMFGNRAQAKAAAERTIQQGTWTLAVFYGCITASDAALTRPG